MIFKINWGPNEVFLNLGPLTIYWYSVMFIIAFSLGYYIVQNIYVNDNNFLDFPGQDGAGYCVFGKVIEGQDVVDKIAKVSTGSANGHQDVPNEHVIIEEAST